MRAPTASAAARGPGPTATTFSPGRWYRERSLKHAVLKRVVQMAVAARDWRLEQLELAAAARSTTCCKRETTAQPSVREPSTRGSARGEPGAAAPAAAAVARLFVEKQYEYPELLFSEERREHK